MKTHPKTSFLKIALPLLLIFGCSGSPTILSERTAHASSRGVTQQSAVSITAIVKAEKANLRNAPSKSARIVAQVHKADLLILVSTIPSGVWYRVRDNRTASEGWIHGNTIALRQTEHGPAASTTQTQPTQRARTTSPAPAGRSYVNVDGKRVPSPVFSDTKPAGATARCRDGSYSFSQHRQGTCSHHGGVAEWF